MADEIADNNILGKKYGRVRTDIYCHSCSKTFVGIIDFDLNGNHEIECPCCGHIHYRFVVNGVVTDQRYHSDANTTVERGRSLWKSSTQPIECSSASVFLRQKWLDRIEGEG